MNLLDEIDFTLINLNNDLERVTTLSYVNESLKDAILLIKKLKKYIENDGL